MPGPRKTEHRIKSTRIQKVLQVIPWKSVTQCVHLKCNVCMFVYGAGAGYTQRTLIIQHVTSRHGKYSNCLFKL